MGRPRRGEELITGDIRVRVEPSIHRKVKIEAAKASLTVSQWVAEAIGAALKKKAA